MLAEIGQVAAEVSCPIDGYREFVSVYATPRENIINFEGRFPYFDKATMLYRAIRFRVRSKLIAEETEVSPNELIGLQEIFLPSEEDVAFVLNLWQIPTADLLPPRQVEIPV